MRGRIFATQVVSANFISLLPLLIIGAVTDWTSITVVLLLIATLVFGLALASHLVSRGQPSTPISAAQEKAPSSVDTAGRLG
jgi:hypothetical protein